MANQSSLGDRQVHRHPNFHKTDMGRVTKNNRYEAHGIIEVVLLDYSKPFPVWVINEIDRKPMTGDHVLISYVGGRKDSPYLVGFVKNKAYTTNFIEVHEDRIRVQLPVKEIGKKNGKAHNDTKSFLTKDANLMDRGFVEIKGAKITIHHPTDIDIVSGGDISLSAQGGISLSAPGAITANGENLKVDNV
jgi:hypothetical protein